jgi:hypothetical protein
MEFIQVFFPVDYSEEDRNKFHEDIKTFAGIVEKNWSECKGIAGGWAAEEVTDPGSGEKARVYAGLISWPSVESHMKYRETDAFKDSIHLLRGAKGLKNVVMNHVNLTEFKA